MTRPPAQIWNSCCKRLYQQLLVPVDVSLGDLPPQVDEVRTLTSPAGFEALLRGKRLVTCGHPFFRGGACSLLY